MKGLYKGIIVLLFFAFILIIFHATFADFVFSCPFGNDCTEVSATSYPVPTNTAPLIENVSISQSASEPYNISWNTGVVADSFVYFGTDATSYKYIQSDSSMSTSHSIFVPYESVSVACANAWNFVVGSTDGSGNANYSAITTFTAPASGLSPVITNVITTSAYNCANTVMMWNTDTSSNSTINYGIYSSEYTTTKSNIITSLTHTITLQNETDYVPYTTYYYAVTSKDTCGRSTTSAEYTFICTTASPPAGSPNCTDTDSSTYPTINADINGTVKIQGDQTSYPDACSGSTNLIEAYCSASNSNAPTYSTISCTKGCNTTVSSEAYCCSASSPCLLQVNLIIYRVQSSPTNSTATITWATSVVANSTVKYGTVSGTYPNNSSSATEVTSHSISLTSLLNGTKYYYVANSSNSTNSSQSSEYSFSTVPLYSCVDTDAVAYSTINYTQNGTVTINGSSYADACINSTTLTEYYCSGAVATGVSSTSKTCSRSCNSGACTAYPKGLFYDTSKDEYAIRQRITDDPITGGEVAPDNSSDWRLIKGDDNCIVDCESQIGLSLYKNMTLPAASNNTFNYSYSMAGQVLLSLSNITIEIYNYTYQNITQSNGLCINTSGTISCSTINESNIVKSENKICGTYFCNTTLIPQEYVFKVIGKKSNTNVSFPYINNIDWAVKTDGFTLQKWAWWNNSWNNRRLINFTSVNVGEIVWINLTWYNITCSNVNCTDIYVTNLTNNLMKYNLPRQNITTTKPNNFLVLPLVDSTKEFYIYYNNTQVSIAPTVNLTVWEDDFESSSVNNQRPRAPPNSNWYGTQGQFFVLYSDCSGTCGQKSIGNSAGGTITETMNFSKSLTNFTVIAEVRNVTPSSANIIGMTIYNNLSGYQLRAMTSTDTMGIGAANAGANEAIYYATSAKRIFNGNWSLSRNGTTLQAVATNQTSRIFIIANNDTFSRFEYFLFLSSSYTAIQILQFKIYDNTAISSTFISTQFENISIYTITDITDITPNEIRRTSPTNTTYGKSKNISITYTLFPSDADFCQYEMAGVNTTLTNGSAKCQNSTFLTNSSGISNINFSIYANDTSGNLNRSVSIMFAVDAEAPFLAFNGTTNTTFNSTTVPFSFNRRDIGNNLGVCMYNVDNGINFTNSACANFTLYNLVVGYHNLTIYANDTLGNVNSTITNFTMDTTVPYLTVESPTNTTYYSTTVSLNFNRNDIANNLNICNRELDGTNTTITSCNNGTFTANNGHHVVKIYVNDTLGNINVTTIDFDVDVTAPTITIIEPQNQTYGTTAVTLTFNAFDSNIGNCTYRLNSGANTTIASCNNGTFTAATGHNIFNITVNDTGSRATTSSTIEFETDSTVPAVAIQNPQNQTYGTYAIKLNFTSSDTNGISQCWYSFNKGISNISLIGCNNLSDITQDIEGNNTLRVYSNDTNNLINFAQVSYTINTSPIINSLQINVTNLGGNHDILLSINITDPDSNRDTCAFGAVFAKNGTGDFCVLNITDVLGQANNTRANDTNSLWATPFGINFSLTNNTYSQNVSFSHNLSVQHMQKNDTIINNHTINILSYFIQHFIPIIASILSGGNFTGSLNVNTNVTMLTEYSGDWLIETEENDTQLVQNVSGNSNLTFQYVVNTTHLNISNLQPFNWTNVNVSSVCKNTNMINIIPPTPNTTLTYVHNNDPSKVVSYDFSEQSGTVIYDKSGYGNDGTIVRAANTTWNSTGRYGGALTFINASGSSTGGYININDNIRFKTLQNFTLALWIYMNAPDFSQPATMLFGKRVPSSKCSTYNSYELRIENTGNISFVTCTNETGQSQAIGTVINNGIWYFVAGVYNSTNNIVYVNGTKVATSTQSGSINYSTDTVKIGTVGGGQSFNGTIDEVVFYNRTLSDQEIMDLYTLRIGGCNNVTSNGDYLSETIGNESQDTSKTTETGGSVSTKVLFNITNTLNTSFSNINISSSKTCRNGWTNNDTLVTMGINQTITGRTLGCNNTNTITKSNLSTVFTLTYTKLGDLVNGSVDMVMNNTDTILGYNSVRVNATNLMPTSWVNLSTLNWTVDINNGTNVTTRMNMTLNATSKTSSETTILVSRVLGSSTTYRCEIGFSVTNDDTKSLTFRIPITESLCAVYAAQSGNEVMIDGTRAAQDVSKAYIDTSMYSGFATVVITPAWSTTYSLLGGTHTANVVYTIVEPISGGGGGGGGGTPTPTNLSQCNAFDIFVPGAYRVANTSLLVEIKQTIGINQSKAFTLNMENLGQKNMNFIWEIIPTTGSNMVPMPESWVTIKKQWSILEAGKTEPFGIEIKVPSNATKGTYVGKVIAGCDPFSDGARLTITVDGTTTQGFQIPLDTTTIIAIVIVIGVVIYIVKP